MLQRACSISYPSPGTPNLVRLNRFIVIKSVCKELHKNWYKIHVTAFHLMVGYTQKKEHGVSQAWLKFIMMWIPWPLYSNLVHKYCVVIILRLITARYLHHFSFMGWSNSIITVLNTSLTSESISGHLLSNVEDKQHWSIWTLRHTKCGIRCLGWVSIPS